MQIIGRQFGWRSTALEVLENIDLNGKTVLITGANSGIGFETAKALAYHNAHVIMTCRNLSSAEKAKEEIIKGYSKAKVDVIFMDASRLKTIESCVQEYIYKGWPLHVLILNAGVYMPSIPFTPDGFESTFQINYLSNFYLVKLLEPILLKSAPARIVHVTSSTHSLVGKFDSNDIEWSKLSPPQTINGIFNTFAAYYRSKSLVCLFSNELQRRLGIHNVTSNSLQPGTCRTHIVRNSLLTRAFFQLPLVIFFNFPYYEWDIVKSIDKCAATSAYCATAPELENVGGCYFVNCKVAHPNPSVLNVETAKKLWHLSEEMIHKWKTAPPDSGLPYALNNQRQMAVEKPMKLPKFFLYILALLFSCCIIFVFCYLLR